MRNKRVQFFYLSTTDGRGGFFSHPALSALLFFFFSFLLLFVDCSPKKPRRSEGILGERETFLEEKELCVEIFGHFLCYILTRNKYTFISLKIYESSSSSSHEISDEKKDSREAGIRFSPLLSPGASGVGFQVDALFFFVSFVERVRSRFGFIFRSPSV